MVIIRNPQNPILIIKAPTLRGCQEPAAKSREGPRKKGQLHRGLGLRGSNLVEECKVESRKLEHQFPPAIQVKYRGSQHHSGVHFRAFRGEFEEMLGRGPSGVLGTSGFRGRFVV